MHFALAESSQELLLMWLIAVTSNVIGAVFTINLFENILTHFLIDGILDPLLGRLLKVFFFLLLQFNQPVNAVPQPGQ